MNKKKGISLIVLIITIIVVIILAAVVIVTISKNNPIKSAKEAKFKEDVRNFQSDLAFTISKQYTESQGNRDFKITIWSIPTTFEEIKKYIPNYIQKYDKKFGIEDDEIVYFESEVTDDEKKWLDDLGMKPWGANIEEASEDIFIWDGSKIIGYNAEPLKEYLSRNDNILKIPEMCTSIGKSAFVMCDSLVSVIITNGVKTIEQRAFWGCTNLTNVTMSDSVTLIDGLAFASCHNLTNIRLSNNIEIIWGCTFSSCDILKNITIPDNVTSIRDSAFEYCKSLESIVIPDKVTLVRERAFLNCTNLKSVVIGKSVVRLEVYAFGNCCNLNNITFNGTKSEWEAITKEAYWNANSNINTITCEDGIITL